MLVIKFRPPLKYEALRHAKSYAKSEQQTVLNYHFSFSGLFLFRIFVITAKDDNVERHLPEL